MYVSKETHYGYLARKRGLCSRFVLLFIFFFCIPYQKCAKSKKMFGDYFYFNVFKPS